MFARLSILTLLLGATFTHARPAEKRWGIIEDALAIAVETDAILVASTCNLQNAVQYMDLAAASLPSTLPAPDPSLQLYHVAIGRGTQNYTCDLTNSTAVPVAIGALATLFNASCIAADAPGLLAVLPEIALDLPQPSATNFEAFLLNDISGHHYFTDNFTLPYFNLDTAMHQWGQGPVSKTGAADAPSNAAPGANGAVQWLALSAVTGETGSFAQVYRLNTAGGDPPATCAGQQASFEVQYAAQYWFFV